MSLSEQEIIRRESLSKLIELGINPYPAEEYPVTHHTSDLSQLPLQTEVCIAGRIMSRNIMGNASFAKIQDSTGRIQIYLKRDELCPTEDKTFYNTVFKKLLDIGDYIGVKGYLFTTQTGELSIHVQELTLLAKSIKPLPIVKVDPDGTIHDAFTDPEQRYRQRYVDLTVNPINRDIFIKRAKVIQSMRNYFIDQNWLEVETPILQPIHGGAAARPFQTHHNTLDMPLYLRIANELYLKRLIVGGFDGVFEFGKMFRNEGMDRTHNPEFTAVELYVAYKDYNWMMDTVEKTLSKVALEVTGSTQVQSQGNLLQFGGKYARIPLFQAIHQFSGINIQGLNEDDLKTVCRDLKITVNPTMGKGKLIDEIFGTYVESNLVQPTFITDYPIEMTPLAKKHRNKPGLVERFELFVNGKEIANAYSELNDPIDQRDRLTAQSSLKSIGDLDAMEVDNDFIRSLEYGMPPTAGLGIGIDRLVMLLTNQTSIQEVLFFPQMKPEKQP